MSARRDSLALGRYLLVAIINHMKVLGSYCIAICIGQAMLNRFVIAQQEVRQLILQQQCHFCMYSGLQSSCNSSKRQKEKRYQHQRKNGKGSIMAGNNHNRRGRVAFIDGPWRDDSEVERRRYQLGTRVKYSFSKIGMGL